MLTFFWNIFSIVFSKLNDIAEIILVYCLSYNFLEFSLYRLNLVLLAFSLYDNLVELSLFDVDKFNSNRLN